jgi:hypothetical protein
MDCKVSDPNDLDIEAVSVQTLGDKRTLRSFVHFAEGRPLRVKISRSAISACFRFGNNI